MELVYIRLGSIIAIALIYMLFDVFNNRDIPTVFVYATLAYGAVLTILYFNLYTALLSAGIAIAILAVGYVVYKIGQLGAADVIEIAAISLVLPIQNIIPLQAQLFQGMPFAISVIIDSGIVALVMVPLYYIPKSYSILRHDFLSKIEKRDIRRSVVTFVAYSLFFLFLIYYGISTIGFAIMTVAIVCVALITLLERPMTLSMISYQKPNKIYQEDIIAINLMDKTSVLAIKEKVPEFGRLMTNGLLDDLRTKVPEVKLPVYRNAIPFAVPIFAGVILALFVGNLLVFIMPFGM